MKWGKWSQTAASNSATPPDGWPEGQAPSTVNDCAREMMAAIATGISDIQFVDLGMVPTQVSATQFTVSGDFTSVIHYGRRIKAMDGANLLYGTVISSSYNGATTGIEMRFDVPGSALDSSLSAFSVGSPAQQFGALPESSFRAKDYVLNSQLDVWQRGGGAWSASVGASPYTADGFQIVCNAATAGAVLSANRGERSAAASNVPTLAQVGIFLNNNLTVQVGTGTITALASADVVEVAFKLEGYDYRQIAGKPLTLSFWVTSNVTGTYCVSLTNSGANQSCVQPYNVSASLVWERKVMSFPPPPTAGTWDYSTGVGLNVRLALAIGGNGILTNAGAWSAVNAYATSAQTNFMANQNKTIKFACFTLNEGYQANPPTPTIYNDEINKCQRRLQVLSACSVFGYAIATSRSLYGLPLSPTMRAAPALSVVGGVTSFRALTGAGVAVSISAITTNQVTINSVLLDVNPVGTPFTAGNGSVFQSSGTGTLVIKAEI